MPAPRLLQMTTGTAGAATVVGGRRVLAATPWYPATVLSLNPEEGPLGFDRNISLTGGNFAPSPWSQCSMGGVVVQCHILDDHRATIPSPAAVTMEQDTPIGVSNDAGLTSGATASFAHRVEELDLHEGLAFYSPMFTKMRTLPGHTGIPNHAVRSALSHPSFLPRQFSFLSSGMPRFNPRNDTGFFGVDLAEKIRSCR